jgi:hypothetical protein
MTPRAQSGPTLAASRPAERHDSHELPEVTLTKKQVKRLLDGARPLDAWERYRALNDAIGEAYDLIDVSNREARFALILMGGLNAVIVMVGTRVDLMSILQRQQRGWTMTLFAVYAVVAVFFLLEAIGALRPGKMRPDLGGWAPDRADYPARLRYYEDVVLRDVESHWNAWRDVQVEQLNADLAVQLHSLSQKNLAMRNSLRRLYTGLRVMTLLVTAVLVLLVISSY